MVPGTLTREHNLVVWAAYACGHHTGLLSGWQQSVWGCRQLIEEGRLDAGKEVPPEMTELARAVEILAHELEIKGSPAVKLGRWVAEWAAAASGMLRDLPPGRRIDTTIDWSAPMPPGTRQCAAIRQTLQPAFGRHPHLGDWFHLGQRLSEERVWGHMTGDLQAELCRAMDALGRMGRYPFLEPLVRVLRARRAERAVPGDLRYRLTDPVLNVLRVSRLEAHLRSCLWDGARPLPVITVDADGIEFFGRTFRREDFRNGEWRVLHYFCSKPMRPLERAHIIQHAGLRCSPRNLAAHVSRLRDKLRPAVKTHFAGGRSPEYADDCFIVGFKTKRSDGPYQLDVDRYCIGVGVPAPSSQECSLQGLNRGRRSAKYSR